MPIYEFECNGCSSRFEIKRSFSESGPVCCPQCGSDTRRIFSPVPIIFKGPGFYVTDSRDNHNPASYEGNKEKPKDADTKAADSKDTDTKPADSKAVDTKAADTGEN